MLFLDRSDFCLNLSITANTRMKDAYDLSECFLTRVCNEMAQEIADSLIYNRALQVGKLSKATASQINWTVCLTA